MTAATMTALDRLYADAEQRGWVPDSGRNARPGCWHSADQRSEFTVSSTDDVSMTIVNAHTPEDTLKLVVGRAGHQDHAVDQLRRFLGWGNQGGEQ